MQLIKIGLSLMIGCMFYSCSAQLNKAVNETERALTLAAYNDSIIKSLQERYDLLIGYATTSDRPGFYKKHFLVGINKNKSVAFRYILTLVRTNNEAPFVLDSIPVPEILRDSIISNYVQIKAWEIYRSEDENTSQCSDIVKHSGCKIVDAETYQLIVTTKSGHRSSSFYAPEYYEKCCPGNEDRRRFLRLVNIIEKVFSH